MSEKPEAGNGHAHEYITGDIERIEKDILVIRTDAGAELRARVSSPAGPGPMFTVGKRWRFGLSEDKTVVSFGDAPSGNRAPQGV